MDRNSAKLVGGQTLKADTEWVLTEGSAQPGEADGAQPGEWYFLTKETRTLSSKQSYWFLRGCMKTSLVALS